MSNELPEFIWAWESSDESDAQFEGGHIQAWEHKGEPGDGTTLYRRIDPQDAERRKELADKLAGNPVRQLALGRSDEFFNELEAYLRSQTP